MWLVMIHLDFLIEANKPILFLIPAELALSRLLSIASHASERDLIFQHSTYRCPDIGGRKR